MARYGYLSAVINKTLSVCLPDSFLFINDDDGIEVL